MITPSTKRPEFPERTGQNFRNAQLQGGILRFDTRVALEWGVLLARLEADGRRMPWRDSVIAATARRHELAIATRNAKDYRHAALKLVNPFGAA